MADFVGVEFPLFAFSRCRDVVAAVSRAGGFGVLGGSSFTPESLGVELQWLDVRVAGKPYGVDILIHEYQALNSGNLALADLISTIPQQHFEIVAALLNEHGIMIGAQVVVSREMPGAAPEITEKLLDVAFRHPIRLIANAFGIAQPPSCRNFKEGFADAITEIAESTES